MSYVVPLGHPYWYVRSIAERYGDEITCFHLSYYEYIPQSLVDKRRTFTVGCDLFQDDRFVAEFLRNVPAGQEVAFHSNVLLRSGEELHIPMIDMSTSSSAQLTKLRPFMGDYLFETFSWYRSGRSFHGYGGQLLAAREWSALLGTLLLANQRGLPPTVDPRWIGHRLVSGYAALRWTKNTWHYIALPEALDWQKSVEHHR